MNQPDPTAALARIRQMTDYWEQHLPEVIRTPAVVSAIRAALELAGQPPAGPDPCSACRYVPCGNCEPAVQSPADRAALRDRIAAAIWERTPEAEPSRHGLVMGNPHGIADAVLAVLPQPTDRAAEVVCICGHPEQRHFEDVCQTCGCGDYLEPRDAAEVLARWRQEALKARATIERVRRLHDALNDETALTSAEDEITRGAAARKIAAALDGWTDPAELRRLAGEQPECIASVSGNCLAEAQSETACDTDDGECVHGGRPAGEQPTNSEAQPQPGTETPHVRAARYAAAGNEMAASLVRDGFGDDEITEILTRPATADDKETQ